MACTVFAIRDSTDEVSSNMLTQCLLFVDFPASRHFIWVDTKWHSSVHFSPP